MKRALSAVLCLALAAPGPAFAGSASKAAGVSVSKLAPAAPPALAVLPMGRGFSGLSALAVEPVAAQALPAPAFPARERAARAADLVSRVADAKPVLDSAFEGASSAEPGEAVAVPAASAEAPPLAQPRRERRAPLGIRASATLALLATPLMPALLHAQQAKEKTAGPYLFVGLAVVGGLFWVWSTLMGRMRDARSAKEAQRKAREAQEQEERFKRRAARSKDGAPTQAFVDNTARFSDIAGQDEAKLELEEVVDFLKNPAAYKSLNPRYKGPKGVLLFGPPGTGKTLLARAVANEAGVPFVQRAGSDFINLYVGNGAKNVRDAFDALRKQLTPGGVGILFIDELEAIGGARAGSGDRAEETRTINALLKEMDGFAKDNIIVIAATNMPEALDPALVRGGRFGTKIPVGLPDVAGREAILAIHMRQAALASDVDRASLARRTPGLAGADLEQIVMDATKLAKRRGASSIAQQDFMKAVDELTTGRQRRLVISEEERRVVAYHEAGHAIVSHLMPNADPVRKVTIIPHGLNALGFMQAMPEQERVLYSREWLVERIAVALGGRAAEKLMTGRVYSGAQNDLQQATRLAKAMVMQFGMSEEIGRVSYDVEGMRPSVGGPLSEATRRTIDAEVRGIIEEALTRVEALLGENRDILQAMADELMAKETLVSEDMDRLLRRPPQSREVLAADGR